MADMDIEMDIDVGMVDDMAVQEVEILVSGDASSAHLTHELTLSKVR